MALPVHEGRDNLIAWHYDNHGQFSVKSAYKVCRTDLLCERSRGGAQGGSENAFYFIRKAIWKLKILGKVKHFFWRLAHNNHPLSWSRTQSN